MGTAPLTCRATAYWTHLSVSSASLSAQHALECSLLRLRPNRRHLRPGANEFCFNLERLKVGRARQQLMSYSKRILNCNSSFSPSRTIFSKLHHLHSARVFSFITSISIAVKNTTIFSCLSSKVVDFVYVPREQGWPHTPRSLTLDFN